MPKTNVTLKLDKELLQRVKVLAAEKGTSVSAVMTEKLEEFVKEKDEYNKAMRRALARMKKGWNLGWQKPKSRDELHDRESLR
jgi:predicted transcriptional regulator